MSDHSKELGHYWTQRYEEKRTGWDIGHVSTPLKLYIDQLENRDIKILIPGAGNAYEAEYLHSLDFKNVDVLDVSPIPLKALHERRPDFPKEHLIEGDFFSHTGQYDMIIEQTFFCSFVPSEENRSRYAEKMSELMLPGGKLVGLWFDHALVKDSEKRPFGGSKEEYWGYLSPYFEVKRFEQCVNSIKPRQGSELFGIFIKNSKPSSKLG